MGNPFQILERIFTEPDLGRFLLLLTIVAALVIVNYDSGFTSHYNLSSQIQEITQIEKTLGTDSTLVARVKTLKSGVLDSIEEHQEVAMSKWGARYLIGFCTGALLLLIYTRSLLVGAAAEQLNDPWQAALPTLVVILGATLAFFLPSMASHFLEQNSVAETITHSIAVEIVLVLVSLLVMAMLSLDEDSGTLGIGGRFLETVGPGRLDTASDSGDIRLPEASESDEPAGE
jgi:hypothetical protein